MAAKKKSLFASDQNLGLVALELLSTSLFMRLLSRLSFPIGLACWGAAGVAWAQPTGPILFCEVYPDASACAVAPPQCTLCHLNTDPEALEWNAYGEDVRSALDGGDFNTLVAAALEAVEADDSDADAFTNLEEIEAGTWPGDPNSAPADTSCPDSSEGLLYPICDYNPSFVFKKIHLDFCGRSPSFAAYQAFGGLSADAALSELDTTLDQCLQSEFWRGRGGQLWQMSYPKVRPVRSLKAGVDGSSIPNIRIADYYNDITLWVWTQIDDHDARDMLLAKYFVLQDGTDFTVVAEIGVSSEVTCTIDDDCPANEACVQDEDAGTLSCLCEGACFESVDYDYRFGLLTTRWVLLYNTMFTAIPRTTAAQAYRAFLGLDIAKQQGLQPVQGEPVDYDNKGVDRKECEVCHSTLDPLTYPFTQYQGFGPNRAAYVADRMTTAQFANEGPDIANTPAAGSIFGTEVANLGEWAQVAANSDQFAQATVGDYWVRLMGGVPTADQAIEFTELWQDFRAVHAYSVRSMLHDFIRTEAYGAP